MGFYENLMKELALKDSEGYRRLLRKGVSTFEELVAPGETQSSSSYQFRIAQNTISGIISAVCLTIYHHLGSEIQVPDSENEWKMVAFGKMEFSTMPWCNGRKAY
ncbi:hypothetical protein TNCT_701351 [Trichonephila clavata]|uniref:Uncharacterized protein n=1 Tax=Trichonephila clavata TaxID=2740835 RepID=A0A8X6LTT3_TRICU|nr:hypothetical protein TNCT_701351 [Trichonephila clavata]